MLAFQGDHYNACRRCGIRRKEKVYKLRLLSKPSKVQKESKSHIDSSFILFSRALIFDPDTEKQCDIAKFQEISSSKKKTSKKVDILESRLSGVIGSLELQSPHHCQVRKLRVLGMPYPRKHYSGHYSRFVSLTIQVIYSGYSK